MMSSNAQQGKQHSTDNTNISADHAGNQGACAIHHANMPKRVSDRAHEELDALESLGAQTKDQFVQRSRRMKALWKLTLLPQIISFLKLFDGATRVLIVLCVVMSVVALVTISVMGYGVGDGSSAHTAQQFITMLFTGI